MSIKDLVPRCPDQQTTVAFLPTVQKKERKKARLVTFYKHHNDLIHIASKYQPTSNPPKNSTPRFEGERQMHWRLTWKEGDDSPERRVAVAFIRVVRNPMNFIHVLPASTLAKRYCYTQQSHSDRPLFSFGVQQLYSTVLILSNVHQAYHPFLFTRKCAK